MDERTRARVTGLTNPEAQDPERSRAYRDLARADLIEQKVDAADVARLRRDLTEGESAGLRTLGEAHHFIDNLLNDFTPNERAYYVGTLNWPLRSIKQLVNDDPRFGQFRTDLALLGLPVESGSLRSWFFGSSSTGLMPGEVETMRRVLPSGRSTPGEFERNLQAYRDVVDSGLNMRISMMGKPVDEFTPANITNMLQGLNEQRYQMRLDAYYQTHPQEIPVVPPAAAETPAAAPPPPAPQAPPAPDWLGGGQIY